MQSPGPWSAEPLGAGRYQFTNTSGGTLALVLLTPIDAARVSVEAGGGINTHVLREPVHPGDSFVAVVRGAGVRITSTAVPAMRPVYWALQVS